MLQYLQKKHDFDKFSFDFLFLFIIKKPKILVPLLVKLTLY